MTLARKDIKEDIPYNLSYTAGVKKWEPSNAAYDISINNTPFFLRIDNQTPYVRESAPFKKDQFDASNTPGEQSLVGWWLRSQTSWHEGAGISYFEPGVEPTAGFRFKNSRGIDCWNIGELRMLPQVYYGYAPTSVSGFHSCEANDGSGDCIILGSNNGSLHKLKITSDENLMSDTPYAITSHTAYPFLSVTTDGTSYFAACSRGIHRGTIGSSSSDVFIYKHSAADSTKAFVKFVKGVLIFSGKATATNQIAPLATTYTTTYVHASGTSIDADPKSTNNFFTHPNPSWTWVDASASPSFIFIAGNANGHSEVYAIGYDDATNEPDFAGAQMSIKLPFGETINRIEYRLGALIIATSKGIRTATQNIYGDLILGPLTFRSEKGTECRGITTKDNYAYVSAQATGPNGIKNAILVRIDLSNKFDDGTHPWAYDLEYRQASNTTFTNEVFNINNQLVMVIDENGSGEVQVEHTTKKVTSGYIDTGIIRYATVEPKFFKYMKINGSINADDFINIQSFDEAGVFTNIDTVTQESINHDVALTSIKASREAAGFRFTFTNGSPYTTVPVMTSYQLKSLPAVKRQRMIQLPLSCFDIEMDRYNSSAGYIGKAYDHLMELEAMEELGDIVSITDYRINETYDAIIEDVRFTNESSPDKINNGFGGTLTVTVRKL